MEKALSAWNPFIHHLNILPWFVLGVTVTKRNQEQGRGRKVSHKVLGRGSLGHVLMWKGETSPVDIDQFVCLPLQKLSSSFFQKVLA